ncbi:trypsin-like cysteine/serine peptidase domain-containing protein [Podospora australis]|uniref:Trypsin-like cysteine/serine peptidase domain-containing protein n=1 Tax=Podospora australis TaxID=1536484 RepID=A0AAN6WIM9_9PEZI|nr:trypsin-like cysteine/serine peptidase domain-containing protein [Podospora australis]
MVNLKTLALAAAAPSTILAGATPNNKVGTGINIATLDLSNLRLSSTASAPGFDPRSKKATRDVLPTETEGELFSRNVIGTDNRVNWNQTVYPYNAIVKVEYIWNGNTRVCSGVLIGPRHVATSRQCAPQFGETNNSYKFMPNFYFGERFPSAGMINWYMDMQSFGDCNVRDDWAIFILNRRLGQELGYFGAKNFDPATQLNKGQMFNYGWPADKSFGWMQPTRQDQISVQSIGTGCEGGGSLRTNTDAVWGQKGGPLWAVENGDRWCYGVLQDEDRTDYTPFAGGSKFVAAVIKTRQDYP